MAKHAAGTVIKPTVMRDAPPISISPQESRALDEAIDNQIKTANDALVQHYLTLAENLHSMHVGRGYEALGFRSWTAYLDKKNTFGRSYLTYLLKLAQAGKHNLEPLMRPGMSATKLITYAKATDFPDKIPQLIRATWSQVAPLSVREAERVVKAYVASHAEAYRKAGKTRKAAPKKQWDKQIAAIVDEIPVDEQGAFKAAMRDWLQTSR